MDHHKPLRYHDLGELDGEAEKGYVTLPKSSTNNVKAQWKLMHKSLKTMDVALRKALRADDDELTYIFAMRFLNLWTTIKKSEQFLDDDWFKKLLPPMDIMIKAEELKKDLKSRYNQQQTSTIQPASSNGAHHQTQPPVMKEITNINRTHFRTQKSEQNGHNQVDSESVILEDQTEIFAADLIALLKQKDPRETVLVIDIRDSNLFIASHIMSHNIINIPEERLLDRHLSVESIEDVLDKSFADLWSMRHEFDLVVIVNAEGKKSKSVFDIINVLTEYSSNPVKRMPRLLSGGFYGLINRFPHNTSNPHHRVPDPQISAPRPRIADIRYPSVSIFNDFPVPVTPELSRKDTEIKQPVETYDNVSPNGSYRRPILQSQMDPAPSPSHTLTVKPVTFRAGTNEPKPPFLPRVPSILPTVDRGTKPAPALSSTSTGVSCIAASKSENSFDNVMNNPNVTKRRGSGEIKAESSDEEVKKPVGVSKLPPEVPRSVKPNISINGIDERSTFLNAEKPSMESKENGHVAPESTTFQDVAEDFRNKRPARQSPSPADASVGKNIASLPTTSFDKPTSTVPVVRNIPIVVEKRSAPAPDPAPEVRRILKPVNNLPTARPFAFPAPPELTGEYELQEKKKPGYTGLKNIGNSCYLNAILQCFAHTRAIRDYYLTGDYKADIRYDNPRGSKGKISVYMAEFMHFMWRENFRYFSPVFMKNCLAEKHSLFQGYKQEDGQEALTFFLQMLHQDTNQAKLVTASDEERRRETEIRDFDKLQSNPALLAKETIKKHKLVSDSLVNSYFSFIEETVLQCRKCRYQSHTYSNDQLLMIDLLHTSSGQHQESELTDLLDKSWNPNETIDSWKCPKCGPNSSAFHVHRFSTVPRILVICLKRFQVLGGFFSSKDDFVHFETELSVSEFCNDNETARKARYRLYAVVDHYGDLDSGHYTASVLNCDTRTEWLKCDDQSVTRMDPRNLVTANAYLLFYEQV